MKARVREVGRNMRITRGGLHLGTGRGQVLRAHQKYHALLPAGRTAVSGASPVTWTAHPFCSARSRKPLTLSKLCAFEKLFYLRVAGVSEKGLFLALSNSRCSKPKRVKNPLPFRRWYPKIFRADMKAVESYGICWFSISLKMVTCGEWLKEQGTTWAAHKLGPNPVKTERRFRGRRNIFFVVLWIDTKGFSRAHNPSSCHQNDHQTKQF